MPCSPVTHYRQREKLVLSSVLMDGAGTDSWKQGQSVRQEPRGSRITHF